MHSISYNPQDWEVSLVIPVRHEELEVYRDYMMCPRSHRCGIRIRIKVLQSPRLVSSEAPSPLVLPLCVTAPSQSPPRAPLSSPAASLVVFTGFCSGSHLIRYQLLNLKSEKPLDSRDSATFCNDMQNMMCMCLCVLS